MRGLLAATTSALRRMASYGLLSRADRLAQHAAGQQDGLPHAARSIAATTPLRQALHARPRTAAAAARLSSASGPCAPHGSAGALAGPPPPPALGWPMLPMHLQRKVDVHRQSHGAEEALAAPAGQAVAAPLSDVEALLGAAAAANGGAPSTNGSGAKGSSTNGSGGGPSTNGGTAAAEVASSCAVSAAEANGSAEANGVLATGAVAGGNRQAVDEGPVAAGGVSDNVPPGSSNGSSSSSNNGAGDAAAAGTAPKPSAASSSASSAAPQAAAADASPEQEQAPSASTSAPAAAAAAAAVGSSAAAASSSEVSSSSNAAAAAAAANSSSSSSSATTAGGSSAEPPASSSDDEHDPAGGSDSGPAVRLMLQSGAAMLPHPDKAHRGGEDSFFIADHQAAIGVADGVGGWIGVDAGAYARLLMVHAKEAADGATKEVEAGTLSAQAILEAAFYRTNVQGSSTACVLVVNGTTLSASNLGDSGFVLVRDGVATFQCPQQQHNFNFPFQLGSADSMSDQPQAAMRFDLELQPGDIIVTGSDGLWDNIFAEEAATIASKCRDKGETATTAAQVLCRYARMRASDAKYHSPFSYAAIQAGYIYLGGKMDDITVLVSYVALPPAKL